MCSTQWYVYSGMCVVHTQYSGMCIRTTQCMYVDVHTYVHHTLYSHTYCVVRIQISGVYYIPTV
jgi:hypothetical protein